MVVQTTLLHTRTLHEQARTLHAHPPPDHRSRPRRPLPPYQPGGSRLDHRRRPDLRDLAGDRRRLALPLDALSKSSANLLDVPLKKSHRGLAVGGDWLDNIAAQCLGPLFGRVDYSHLLRGPLANNGAIFGNRCKNSSKALGAPWESAVPSLPSGKCGDRCTWERASLQASKTTCRAVSSAPLVFKRCIALMVCPQMRSTCSRHGQLWLSYFGMAGS